MRDVNSLAVLLKDSTGQDTDRLGMYHAACEFKDAAKGYKSHRPGMAMV